MLLGEIKAEALRIWDIRDRDLIGDNRFVEMTRPRMALYKVYRDRGMSLTQIGRYLKRDHSTVLSGLRRIEVVMAKDPTYKEQVESLGAKFIDVPYETAEEKEAAEGVGGYARPMPQSWLNSGIQLISFT